MLRSLVLAGLASWATPAFAQEASYCDSGIVAERFETEVDPPPRGIVSYAVVLRNTLEQERRFVLVVAASLFRRPSGAGRTIEAGGTLTVALGYQPWQPGVAPLRSEQLAQVLRISCLPDR